MIKPACLITWPVHIDFPLFRYNLRKYHTLFEDTFIAFTNENQPINYMGWLAENMQFAQTTKAFYNTPDWRNDTVNTMLSLETKADYYLFIEQDFLFHNRRFLDRVLSSDEPFIYFTEGDRIHPAFAIIRRDIINKTNHDFSAYPEQGLDHFGIFFQEIKALLPGKELRELGLKYREDFYHMSGLTHNYYCADHNQPLYKREEFLSYNLQSMLLPYQIPHFYRRQLDIAERYGYSDSQTFLNNFFPGEEQYD